MHPAPLQEEDEEEPQPGDPGSPAGAAASRWAMLRQALLQPKVFLPVLLTVALLAFALGITDLPRVLGRIQRLSAGAIAACGGLAVGYLVLKGLLFALLLHALELPLHGRALLLAYAIGEMSVTIPSGIYVQNYVLRRARGTDFALSAAATTAMLALEGAVVLAVLLLLGIPGWHWLRPAIVGFFLLSAAVLVVLARSGRLQRRMSASLQQGRLKKLGRGLIRMVQGLRWLVRWRVLLPATLLTLGYLLALAAAFWLAGRGVGLAAFGFREATTIYFFSLAVILLLGAVLSQLGVVEAVGLTAALAWGYDLNEGLAALLGFRLVWMASIWLVCGVVAGALLRELGGSRRG